MINLDYFIFFSNKQTMPSKVCKIPSSIFSPPVFAPVNHHGMMGPIYQLPKSRIGPPPTSSHRESDDYSISESVSSESSVPKVPLVEYGSSKMAHRDFISAKQKLVQEEKSQLLEANRDELLERMIQKFGDVDSYHAHLRERADYREEVSKHENAGGFVSKVRNYGNIRKVADLRDGWAHLESANIESSNKCMSSQKSNNSSFRSWADMMDDEE